MSGSLPSHFILLQHMTLLVLPILFRRDVCGMPSSPLDAVRQHSLFLHNHASSAASLRGTRDPAL
ncbi:hypothetical protein K503DRAFT_777455 [Rhizopogon vinicolor AM-OR11-026]|uniref:Secreted protein n=1 Tax=Rhizopogon vinicolor AM-OR11-026 TaxID=1314800 RepID=A0A1B7MG59_9AGAM|nr:hypothetical protein K503DRAFT_777455 [Rhizopogon vinicolor AM-OR11-026]